jgi:signal transduction histidine kinase
MSAPTLARRLVAPIGLVALVVVLGALQYRWLAQVSEADRARLQESLQRQAHAFADAFDAEVLGIAVALQTGEPLSPERPALLERRLTAWRGRTTFPQMLRTVYLVDARERDTLRQFEESDARFVTVPWPAGYDGVRGEIGRLAERPAASPHVGARNKVVLGDVPALLVPVHTDTGEGVLVVCLSLDAIRSSVFPALTAQYLAGEPGNPAGLLIRVMDAHADAHVVFSMGPTSDSGAGRAHADANVPLFALRDDLLPRVRARLDVNGTAGTSPHDGRQTDPAAWRLVVQRPPGSLDATVADARTRNLGLGFSVLAVLMAGVGLVVLNARRAQHLARQQINFVATVSHELRTPLAVIGSAAQNLSAGVIHSPGRAREYGDIIDAEAHRLGEMVEQVLAYASWQRGGQAVPTTLVDVADLVHGAQVKWSTRLEAEQIEFECQCPAGGLTMRGDAAALGRALDNLIANAAKHAGNGRWLAVTARRSERRGRAEVELAVCDRGPGLDPGEMRHVFDPFYRGRSAIERQVPGNGLGLSLVKHVAESHGGRVEVQSVPGNGAVFTLVLPAAATARDAEAAAGAERAS